MTDQILKNYHQQLDYLREAGNSFSKKHPKTAGLLKLDQQGSSDPFMERMLQSFAFLTAKIQANHEQDQDYLAQSLLNLLYPMATLPLPSVTTIQLKPRDNCDHVVNVPKHTSLESSAAISKKCYFRTGYDLDLMPLNLTHQSIQPIVELPEGIVGPNNAKAYFSFNIQSTHESFDFDQIIDKPLNIYMKAFKQYAQSMTAYLLQHQITCLVTALSAENVMTEVLPQPFSAVGFQHDDLLIPCEKSGYEDCQVFTEFAIYPEKHQYIAFDDFHRVTQALGTTDIECYVFLDRYDNEMVSAMSKTELCLGCVPVINLFEAESKSIVIDKQLSDYPLESSLPLAKEDIEIYKVLDCKVWVKGGKDYITKPMYQTRSNQLSEEETVYWEVHKKNCWEIGRPEISGTESLIHMHLPDDSHDKSFMSAQLLCTNRDAMLVANFCQQPNELVMQHIKDQVFDVEMLYHPSTPVRTVDTYKMYQVLSLLSGAHQNIFSFEEAGDHTADLKQALNALNRSGHQEVSQLIDQIHSIKSRRITKRYPVKKQLIYVSGLEVDISIKADSSQEGLLYFFGHALSSLSKHYCPINSFIVITIENQTTGKEMSWPPQFQ